MAATGVAAATVTGVLLVPGLGTSPAYCVQEGNAGEIVVEIHRPEDATGLERALAAHGVTADVTYLPGMKTCAPGRYEQVDREVGMTVGMGQDLVRVTLPPGAVRPGEIFVMVWSVEPLDDGSSASVDANVTAGPIGPCDVVDAPRD